MASPAQPSQPCLATRSVMPAGSSASRPPAPSSHIRVVVTKYACAGSTEDSWTEYASEAATTPAVSVNTIRCASVVRRAAPPARRAMSSATRNSSGQTR